MSGRQSDSGPSGRLPSWRAGAPLAAPKSTRRRLAGGVGYALICAVAAVVLVTSGFAYNTVRAVQAIGGSDAIVSGPSVGVQNILLMGLESRTYWNGTILPNYILDKLHAGSRQAVLNGVGGNATNTLILIHIPAGGKHAVGFSIPRDDWVQFADTIGPQQQGKIDQAYGVSLFYREQQLRKSDPGISRDRLAYLGNEAGQAAEVATVEKLTGVHIDHFAVINLYGFYELARVLGGVEVCLNHAVNDPYSGAHFKAGYQHLDAAQALAFVRQRHGLPNGDLDRTHRQQAFIDSVIHQLRTQGVLSDLSKISALLAVAQHYVITDRGWNLLQFAAQMRDIGARDLTFRTLPIVRYATVNGQDVNIVKPSYIQALVHEVFYPRHRPHRAATKATPKATVDVLNGGHTTGLAARISTDLVRDGYRQGTVGNTAVRATTAVLYGSGAAADAATIARMFGVTASQSSSVRAGHVEILLGTSATTVPSALSGTQAPASSPAPTASSSTPVPIPTTGPQGGAVTVNPKYGIPCVN